jgi:hypothetical protein
MKNGRKMGQEQRRRMDQETDSKHQGMDQKRSHRSEPLYFPIPYGTWKFWQLLAKNQED